MNNASLEQWQLLAAVVDSGSFASAAEQLCKSQSAVSYGIKQLQQSLGVTLLQQQGRRAVLTEAGELLLKRARYLLQEAQDIQQFAQRLGNHQPRLSVAIEGLLPDQVLTSALAELIAFSPDTQVQVDTAVLSGGVEALLSRHIDLAVVPEVPPGFLGSLLMEAPLVLVAAPVHPLVVLAHRRQSLGFADLRRERQIVIRDSGIRRRQDAGWLDANRRITVSTLALSLQVVKAGLGFAWLPLHAIIPSLQTGELQRLPLVEGAVRRVPLYCIHTQAELVPPAQQYFADALRRHIARLDEGSWLQDLS